MQTRLFRLIMLLAGLLPLASCASYRDIEVKNINVNNVVMQGTKIVIDFSATVHNPNRAFVLQSAEGELNNGQQFVASAQLMQAITIAAKSEQRCSGRIEFTIHNLLAVFQMGTDYTSWDLSPFLFTGDMTIKSAWVKKRFNYKEIPLTQLINSLQ